MRKEISLFPAYLRLALRRTVKHKGHSLLNVLALTVALLTVSYQSVRAAAANPVESLRYE